MTHEIQKLSEDYINGIISIISGKIDEKINAIDVTPVDEDQVREIAKEEVSDALENATIDVEAFIR
jgi:hypothetical protein